MRTTRCWRCTWRSGRATLSIGRRSAAWVETHTVAAWDAYGCSLAQPVRATLGSMVKMPPSAGPELCAFASSGRAWRLWAAQHSQGEGPVTGVPATASGARVRRLMSRRFHRPCVTIQACGDERERTNPSPSPSPCPNPDPSPTQARSDERERPAQGCARRAALRGRAGAR